MTPHALLFTIAAIGISETAYLIRKRIALEQPFCPLGESCVSVLTSKYNRLFGLVHNDILGLLFYITLAAFTAFIVIGFGPLAIWDLIMKVLLAIGAFISAVLIYLQWKVIKAWCSWCLLSAGTVGLMGLIVLTSNLIL